MTRVRAPLERGGATLARPVGRWRARARHAGASLRTFLRNPLAATGVAILTIYVTMAVAHPILMATVWRPYGMVYRPEAGFDLEIAFHPAPPSGRHLLGTDALGRDVLSMLLHATGPTLVTALTAAVTIGIVATLAAAVAVTFRGGVDLTVGQIADALVLLPAPIVLIVLGIARPETFTAPVFGAVYGVLAGLGGATIVLRSQALGVMARPFITAARTAGGGPWHVLRVHLLPHLVPMAVVQMMAGVVGVIVAQGFVQYLLHAQTTLGYGSLIYSGLTYQGLVTTDVAWNVLLAGALGISILCGAFHLVSLGLRQVTDPRNTT